MCVISDVEVVNQLLASASSGHFEFALWNSTSVGYLLQAITYLDANNKHNDPKYYPLFKMIREFNIWLKKRRPKYVCQDDGYKTEIADFISKIG